jgi:hypothetical protein
MAAAGSRRIRRLGAAPCPKVWPGSADAAVAKGWAHFEQAHTQKAADAKHRGRAGFDRNGHGSPRRFYRSILM